MWHDNFTVEPTDSARLHSTTTRALPPSYLMFLSHFIVIDEKKKSKEFLTKELSNEGSWKKVLFYYVSANYIPHFSYTLITHLTYAWP